MRILLVWPNKDQYGFKPMGLSLLSAILKKEGHIVELFDTTYIDFGFKTNIEVLTEIKVFKAVNLSKFNLSKKKVDLETELVKRLDSFKPDVVALSVLSDEIYIGHSISHIVKKWDKNTIVVWGNKAATMMPEQILANCDIDFVCIGEGINFISNFVEYIRQNKDLRVLPNLAFRDATGNTVKNKLEPFYQNLDSLPYYDWSIFDDRHFITVYDGKIYRGGDHMIFWGCPNQCTYCINASYRKLYGNNAGRFLRKYSVDRIIKELKYLVDTWELNFFKFRDEDFCLKPIDYFTELAEKYVNTINVPFTIMANARNITKEKVKLLKKMNCRSVSIGIENGNIKLRKEVLKRMETPDEIVKAVKLLNDAKIRTVSFNMLGIPFETRETIKETIDLNRRANIKYADSVFFFPLENTPLREISIKNNFFDENSGKVFQTDKPALSFPNLSADELIAIRERFILYIKLPCEFYKYIERSKINDKVATALTKRLYNIFDECVTANNGFWNNNIDIAPYLKELESMVLQFSV